MKKLIALILLLVTVAGTFIPCCETDDCSADSQRTSSTGDEPQGACSPFFSCATCPGFVEVTKPLQLPELILSILPVHFEKPVGARLNSFPRSFWQPPRFA